VASILKTAGRRFSSFCGEAAPPLKNPYFLTFSSQKPSAEKFHVKNFSNSLDYLFSAYYNEIKQGEAVCIASFHKTKGAFPCSISELPQEHSAD
jgi:hypothetical protein